MERLSSKKNNSKNIFDSFGLLCNILPYFGHLDQSYKMMSQLNRNSIKRWKEFEEEFCLSLLDKRRRRLSLCFSYSDKLLNWKLGEIVQFLKEYPVLIKIFKLPYLSITSSSDLALLMTFFKKVDNRFIRFTTINFEKVALETEFHSKYKELLKKQGLNHESETFYHYISNKGIFLNMNDNSSNIGNDQEVPKTTCCIMLSQDSVVNEANLEIIDEPIRDSITWLKINYIKNTNDYISFCDQSKRIVN